MFSLKHTNVMSLRGVCVAAESPLLIMPFMINGSVLEFVQHHKDELLCISTEAKVLVLCSKRGLRKPLWLTLTGGISQRKAVENLSPNFEGHGVPRPAECCSSRPGSEQLHV